jgi:DNA replication and repair protein RecF
LHIASLYLRDFRNYREERLTFSDCTNLILGNNGRGKTNLLEAIVVLTTSKSFRHVSDQKLRRWGAAGYTVRGVFVGEGGDCDIVLDYSGQKKDLTINGVRENKLSNILGQVYCVLFSFEDILFVTGPPYLRRGFLDLVLATVYPLYYSNLKTYLHLIKQKNRYLVDSENIDETLLSTWNEGLSQTGTFILKKRMELVQFINVYIEQNSDSLTQFSGPLNLHYRSTVPVLSPSVSDSELHTGFMEVLEKKKNTELRLRRAVVGPHRDDFSFLDEKSEIRFFGSVGEARLSSIILKLAQAAFYRETKNVNPLILVDDILLELDSGNRESVLGLFGRGNQILIATTERIRLPEIFSPDRVFIISDKGEITCKEEKDHH